MYRKKVDLTRFDGKNKSGYKPPT